MLKKIIKELSNKIIGKILLIMSILSSIPSCAKYGNLPSFTYENQTANHIYKIKMKWDNYMPVGDVRKKIVAYGASGTKSFNPRKNFNLFSKVKLSWLNYEGKKIEQEFNLKESDFKNPKELLGPYASAYFYFYEDYAELRLFYNYEDYWKVRDEKFAEIKQKIKENKNNQKTTADERAKAMDLVLEIEQQVIIAKKKRNNEKRNYKRYNDAKKEYQEYLDESYDGDFIGFMKNSEQKRKDKAFKKIQSYKNFYKTTNKKNKEILDRVFSGDFLKNCCNYIKE